MLNLFLKFILPCLVTYFLAHADEPSNGCLYNEKILSYGHVIPMGDQAGICTLRRRVSIRKCPKNEEIALNVHGDADCFLKTEPRKCPEGYHDVPPHDIARLTCLTPVKYCRYFKEGFQVLQASDGKWKCLVRDFKGECPENTFPELIYGKPACVGEVTCNGNLRPRIQDRIKNNSWQCEYRGKNSTCPKSSYLAKDHSGAWRCHSRIIVQ